MDGFVLRKTVYTSTIITSQASIVVVVSRTKIALRIMLHLWCYEVNIRFCWCVDKRISFTIEYIRKSTVEDRLHFFLVVITRKNCSKNINKKKERDLHNS